MHIIYLLSLEGEICGLFFDGRPWLHGLECVYIPGIDVVCIYCRVMENITHYLLREPETTIDLIYLFSWLKPSAFSPSKEFLFRSKSLKGDDCFVKSSDNKKTNGCFQKWWYPQIINFNRDFHSTPSILGFFPLFLETPKCMGGRVTIFFANVVKSCTIGLDLCFC